MSYNLSLPMKTRNKSKLLKKLLGGEWVYKNLRRWECNDGRVVRYTAPPVDEWDNVCGVSQCWLDTPDGKTKPFYW